MKSPVAISCFPLLFLVLQASSCSASRPEASRSLLQLDIVAAGVGCVSGDLCSNGDGTTSECEGNLCASLSAGASCKTDDLCKSEIATNGDVAATTLCPSDPDNNNGTCPTIPALGYCGTGDRCSVDARSTILCPTTTAAFAQCPAFRSNVQCSALTGDCPSVQRCTAVPPVSLLSANPNREPLASQDSTVGTCVAPKAAAAACTTGSDICRSQPTADPSNYCPSGTCRMARPGAECVSTTPADRCYNGGVNNNGIPCPDDECPPVDAGRQCYVGDACAGTQLCNAVGAAVGNCVDVKNPGASCSSTATTGAQATVVEFCRVTKLDATGDPKITAEVCTSSQCPHVPAGQACRYSSNPADLDKCSDGSGTGSGTDCPPEQLCPAITAAGACLRDDECVVANAYCSATGYTANSKGNCKVSVAPGATCAATDLCAGVAGTFSVCPSSLICPGIPAGAACLRSSAAGASDGNERGTANLVINDKCFNGTNSLTDCPEETLFCPRLRTGMTCTANDLCVKGAKCINGRCYPNNKVFASTTTNPAPTPAARVANAQFSTAASSPGVKSVATLAGYDTREAFTGAEETKFINTLQANILARLGVVSNVTINSVVKGSVLVDNTVAFTGADVTAAKQAQGSLVALLNSQAGVSSVYGADYGTVTVASVSSVDSANPNADTPSGAMMGASWTAGVVLMTTAIVMAV